MTVQASILIGYEAASAAAVQELVAALNLPDGASVTATVTEQVAGGVVEGGQITTPAPPASEPAPAP